MTLKITFSEDTEAKLREKAQAAGKDIEAFVRDAVEEKLGANGQQANGAADPWLNALRAWAASHVPPGRGNRWADDSRESIYAGAVDDPR